MGGFSDDCFDVRETVVDGGDEVCCECCQEKEDELGVVCELCGDRVWWA